MATKKLGKGNFGSSDKRPSFYKIIWFANTINLRIPPAFKHHILSDESATLKTPLGNWVVKLVQRKGDTYFAEKGWQEFLKHNSLGRAEFVVFKYNGDKSFNVVIYEKNGCKRNYPSASRFTSPFHFFNHVIKNSNIGTPSTMLIPKKFQKKYLPLSKQEITLQDSEGINWLVNVNVTSNNLLCFAGGWKAFVDSHSIKKDDICTFELVEQNTFKVCIFSS
ncbi:hypothetical protein CASFOL_036106 [Castilleja foliolosa]|uniref:TF-B3 domain-containing protein n=1 Tax=Castilleja foliolosa TaxID=1961234 RepID=A0ABD3BV81_9LAMI